MKALSKVTIEVEGLRTYFEVRKSFFSKPAQLRAVDNVSLTVERGEILALVGESGCGKTSLGRSILRLVEPNGGKIIFDGNDVTHLSERELVDFRRRTGMVFQDPYASIDPTFDVYAAVEEPLNVHKIGNKSEKSEAIHKSLKDVKLEPVEYFAKIYPHRLSGGQRQRVALARTLVTNPEFIVADEPVSMLDASVRVEILLLLKELKMKYNVSFLYITHDIATSSYCSDRMVIMYAGKIIESGPTQELLDGPLHPYTQALFAVIPEPDPANRLKERRVVSGEPPSLLNPPLACKFHPRCPIFLAGKCDVIEPELIELKPGRYVACHRA